MAVPVSAHRCSDIRLVCCHRFEESIIFLNGHNPNVLVMINAYYTQIHWYRLCLNVQDHKLELQHAMCRSTAPELAAMLIIDAGVLWPRLLIEQIAGLVISQANISSGGYNCVCVCVCLCALLLKSEWRDCVSFSMWKSRDAELHLCATANWPSACACSVGVYITVRAVKKKNPTHAV